MTELQGEDEEREVAPCRPCDHLANQSVIPNGFYGGGVSAGRRNRSWKTTTSELTDRSTGEFGGKLGYPLRDANWRIPGDPRPTALAFLSTSDCDFTPLRVKELAKVGNEQGDGRGGKSD